MSLPSAPSTEPVRQPASRRKHARRKSDQWVYIDMGAKNGGFLRDLSEGGVCFQWFPGIMPLKDGQTLQVKFKLPDKNAPIEAEGQFVRHDTSENGGGLRLLNLPAEVQRQIREWVARQEHTEADVSGDPSVLPEPSGPITVVHASVSSLAARPGEFSAEVPLVGRNPRGVSVESATAKQELPVATPLASLYPPKGQNGQGRDASERSAVLISELARPAITAAANKLKKAWAVLQSIAVRRESAAKAWRKSPFGVGLAVGSLALFAIGGVLVATGRLSLNMSSGGNPRSTVQAPAANTTEAPVKPQPEVSGISLPSTPTPSPQTAATGQRSVAETVRPSPSHSAIASRAVQRVVNPPVAETNASPGQPSVPAPTLSAAISTAAPISAADTAPAAPKAQRQTNVTEAKQPDRTPARGPSIPNLKMRSPKAPKPALAKLADGSSLGAPDLTSAVALGGVPAGALLPSVARAENQPAPPPSAAPRVSTAKSVSDPTLISSTRPVYPDMAKQTNVQGIVLLALTVDAKGSVVDAKVVSGPILLRQAALEAVKKWKYSPALLDGKPTSSQITVDLNFRLN